MENITKALMIAAGILFAILVLTLLVIFSNQMSSYFQEQHNAKMVEQITEFNNKFENYNGQTIRGNELISVMNKVVDYNRTYSDMEGTERVTISIDLKGHQKDFLYNNSVSNSDVLFQKTTITNASGDDDEISNISGLSAELSSDLSSKLALRVDDTKLQKLSSDIYIICNNSTEESDVNARNEKLKKILGKTFTQTELKDIQSATMKYYQLTQFKRAMFKCTSIVHSQTDGRINRISFEAVIEDNMIKLN